MNVLFLDDRTARCRWAVQNLGPGNVLFVAKTAARAIVRLGNTATNSESFDVVYLDHDLEGEDQNSADENCGMEVVRWVERNKPNVGRFVVHSHNETAAAEMLERLTRAGYEAKYVGFMRLVEGQR